MENISISKEKVKKVEKASFWGCYLWTLTREAAFVGFVCSGLKATFKHVLNTGPVESVADTVWLAHVNEVAVLLKL